MNKPTYDLAEEMNKHLIANDQNQVIEDSSVGQALELLNIACRTLDKTNQSKYSEAITKVMTKIAKKV